MVRNQKWTKLLPFSVFLLFTACSKPTGPIEVTWTGRVLDDLSNQPIAQQSVVLRGAGFSETYALQFTPVLKETTTDDDGEFIFQFTHNEDDYFWYAVQAEHIEYLKGAALSERNKPAPLIELDLRLKPKAWLRIRVKDVPELEDHDGVVFVGLNDESNLASPWVQNASTFVFPANGDTTFIAFKPGGVKTGFFYWNDVQGYIKFEDTFVPHDTTDLLFTY